MLFFLKKTFFSIALIPILAAPLILTSCFNTFQVQFPPKNINLNGNTGVTDIISDPNTQPILDFKNGGFTLGNVSPISAVQPTGDFIPFDREQTTEPTWRNFSKLHTKNILNSLIVGSGSNIDGAYTTVQLLRSLFLNQTMLASDQDLKNMTTLEKNNWDDFMLLVANNLNQSSGTFVDPKDQFLFDISNMQIAVSASSSAKIPYVGPLPSIAPGNAALNPLLYNTQINLTISAINFQFFDFNGNPIAPPSVNSSQFQLLKEIGFNADSIANEYTLELNAPIKFSVEQIIYKISTWKDVENTFPTPITTGLINREEDAIFIGIKIDDNPMTNALNIRIIESINNAQTQLRRSRPVQASETFLAAAPTLARSYNKNSPVTSIFRLLPRILN